MSEFGHKYPQGFLICALIAHPLDQVQQFTGVTSVIDIGNENSGDFELGATSLIATPGPKATWSMTPDTKGAIQYDSQVSS